MITNLFEEEKPQYLSVNKNGFILDGKQYSIINAFIENIIPVRKLFVDKSIKCYSNDAKKGKEGQRCSLCIRHSRCSKRLRLMMLLAIKNEEKIPAILEINQNSFNNLEKMLENIKEEELRQILIEIKVKQVKGYLQVFFKSIF